MSEVPYRIATGVLLFALLVIRVAYGLPARRSRGSLRERGPFRDRVAVGAVGTALALLAIYVVVPLPAVFGLPFPPALRWAGAAVFAIGDIGFLWAHAALGRAWSVGSGTAEGQHLVTVGPYRHVRHPMYAAIMLTALGSLLLTADWLAGGAYVVAVVGLYLVRVKGEEESLVLLFGEEYRAYMTRTPRLIPDLPELKRSRR